MTVRCDIRNPSLTDLAAALMPGPRPDLWNASDCVPTHSGKSALNHVFAHLRATKVLENKNSKILTPPWLGYWVYNALRPHGFPVLHDDSGVKAALVYHQYGFPQDLDAIKNRCADRGIAIVEDCAHALEGLYKGRPLGTEGVAGVFSLSKFFPSQIGGAVRSSDPALRETVARREAESSAALGAFSFAAKLAVMHSRSGGRESSVPRRLNELAYAGYPHSRRLEWSGRLCTIASSRGEMAARRRNYAAYRRLLSGVDEVQRLEADATPYVLPLMLPKKETLEKIAAALRGAGYDTGIYSFDANRNMFEARYVPCVWLPVHGGVDDSAVATIAGMVKELL